MTDEELGTVSARGFESVGTPGILDEQNNFSSVVLSGGAQSGASALALYNVVVSNVNVQQNLNALSKVQDALRIYRQRPGRPE